MTTQFQINLKKNGNTPLKMENYAKALLTQKGILRLNGASNNAFAKSRLEILINKINHLKKESNTEKAG